MTKRFALTLAVAAALAAPAAIARADVQTPVTTGCPASYDRKSLGELSEYFVAGAVDTAGNNNDFVCALALSEAARLALCGPSCPVPVLYQFKDDDNPAQRATG